MAASRAMERLLRVRTAEEEKCQEELRKAANELAQLEGALTAAGERERVGRRQLVASAMTGELIDRVAAMAEMRAGQRHRDKLLSKVAEAEHEAAARRQEFFAKRTERKKVESLIQKLEIEEAATSERRSQREMDDWYLERLR
jgi:flagellar export protein FliJ